MAGTRELIHLPLRHHLLQPQQVLDDSHRIPNLRAASWYRGVSLYPPKLNINQLRSEMKTLYICHGDPPPSTWRRQFL